MNRLQHETSPYLLQHASNPVDWFPWGEEALERARTEDKPILLSIGYAACHWCHVMERESFEDPETAALMNERFVSIKVDREERPDLDAIYMDAVQAMTGSGGWPLTAFLTTDGRPFFAGTYFPDEDRHGLPSFRKVLAAIADVWEHRRAEAETQSAKVTEAIERTGRLGASAEPLTEEVLRAAFDGLRAAFDPRWGGFGRAPKFPQPMTLEFCLRMHLRGAPDALELVTTTLDRMAGGGMYDQLGGGFHRYSTDERWLVPHFEKMLYDNALLIRLYVHAWQVTGNERYRTVATQTCDYLLRELRHPEGGFFSSQDADSEGVEGRFFVWSWDELVEVGGEAVATAFGATPSGNWEGTNVLWRPLPLDAVAAELELDAGRARARPGDGEVEAVRAPRGTGPPRDRRQGARGLERDGDRRARRGRAGVRRGRGTSRPRSGRPSSSSSTCATARGGSCVRGATAGRGGPRSPTTTRRWRMRAWSCTRRPSSSGGSSTRGRWRTSSCAGSATRNAAASSRRATTRRRWSSGRRTCRTTPCRAATPPRPRSCCASRT